MIEFLIAQGAEVNARTIDGVSFIFSEHHYMNV
jgi:hypothetical protein